MDNRANKRMNYYLLVLGRITTKVGNVIFDFVNNSLIVSKPHLRHLLALYQSTETFITILFNFLGGIFADLKDRKKILVITDIIASIVCFLLAYFYDKFHNVNHIIVANIILAFLYAFNSPTYKAIVKDALNSEDIVSYNSVNNILSEVISISAPILGVFIINFFSYKFAMIINALTFLISALCEFKLHISKSNDGSKVKINFWKEFLAGFLYLKDKRELILIIAASSLANIFIAGHNLYIPYTTKFSDGFSSMYANILIAESIGSILAGLIAKRNSSISSKKLLKQLFLCGLSLASLSIIAPLTNNFGSILKMFLLLIPFLFFGITLSLFNIAVISLIQINTDTNFIGRVFSMVFTFAVLFMPIGSFLFSFFDPSWNMIAFLGGLISLSAILLIFVSRGKYVNFR